MEVGYMEVLKEWQFEGINYNRFNGTFTSLIFSYEQNCRIGVDY